jgi:hypothetical protein
MGIETSIFSRLTDEAGDLYDLTAERVYPIRMPQNVTFPCVTYQRIATERYSAMGADTQLADSRWQFDYWATDPDAIREGADALRERLQRWTASSPVVIQDTFILSERDEFADEAGDAQLYRAILDVRLIYEE